MENQNKKESQEPSSNDGIVSGSFIKERYIKCPYIEKNCKWLLAGKHEGYSYLDDTCYLSGSFNLQCPD